MNSYPAQSFLRHKKTLEKAEPSDIKRMAFIGDKLISAALTVNLSKYDLSAGQSCAIVSSYLSNENLSNMCGFPIRNKTGNKITNSHSKGTYIEAAFYLDHEKFGFDFLVKNSTNLAYKTPVTSIISNTK